MTSSKEVKWECNRNPGINRQNAINGARTTSCLRQRNVSVSGVHFECFAIKVKQFRCFSLTKVGRVRLIRALTYESATGNNLNHAFPANVFGQKL
jgi:hypothetical protein